MIIDELNKKIADIESLANDKTSTIESKVSDLTDGLLMVADAVDIIPEMVDEKITAITKEFSIIKDSVSKVKAQKGDNGRDGIDGLDGLNGRDGKDGSPDKPKDIADKLNTLDKVLDWKVLKDFDSLVNQNDLKSAVQTLENQTRFLIQSNASKTNGSNTSTTINGLAGSVNLLEGAGIDITTVGQDITIAAIGANVPSDTQLAVRMATTVALPGAPVYANGIAGVGATLTRGTNGALASIDGVTPMVGDYILVKNQAAKLQNGVYEVTNLGSASVKYVLTRVTEADTTIELDDLVVTAALGTTNKGIPYGQQTNNPVIGTSNIVFTATGIYVRQQTSGTQVAGQVPVWSGTALTLTKGDPLFTRNATTKYTEVAREYDSTALNKQFTGTGFDNLNIDSITNQVDTTITIDSQNNFSGIYSGSTTSNDASVNYAAYTGQRPIQFTFGIDAVNDELSTGSGGFTGTPINGEVFNDGLGNSFKFISYNIGTDTIYAYSVVGNVVGTYTGADSGATVTLINTFTTGSSEVGIWTDSLGNNGVWSIVITVPYTIGTGANTLDVTLTSNGHNNGDFWSTTFVTGGIIYDVQSQSGTLTQGETLTGSLGTTATFAFQYSGGGQQIVLTNIVGSLASGNVSETFTGSLSGNTVLFDNPVTYVDTYSATDGVSTITQIPTESESNQDILGNITINWDSETGHDIGDQWVIAFLPITLTTGYESNQITFPGVPFPLDASAMVATDGTDKVAIGVFDLSPLGQDKLTPGIIALYDDGSQSTFTQNKGYSNLSVFDIATNKSINVDYSGNAFKIEGYNGSNIFQLILNSTNFKYKTNAYTFTLPNITGVAGSIATDMNGDGVITMERPIFETMPSYADDTAAGIAGLGIGKPYQTDGTGAAPLNVPGIVMIKQ